MNVIPTEYRGLRYRSRTEARWAVVFDKLGWPHHYEMEAYRLPSGSYLPDFFLPDFSKFFEVKGKIPTDHERQLAEELCLASKCDVLISSGPPDPGRDEWNLDIFSYIYWELDDEPCVDFQMGGFVSGRFSNHPTCSLHVGNLQYLGTHREIGWESAFRAAANARFGVFE